MPTFASNPKLHLMNYIWLLSCLLSLTLNTFAQTHPMRSVEELINNEDPGWPVVQEWIQHATNAVEVLAVDAEKGRDALYKTQVTTRSPMGAIVYSTGGIFIDHGWIRILGGGSPRLNRSLPEWNKGKGMPGYDQYAAYLLIADDAVGGYFALNGGGLGNDRGKIYYWAPDTQAWESLDLSYSDFLGWCFGGDLNDFYKGFRWQSWQDDVAKLDGNEVFNFFPPLFTAEGKDINKVSRKPMAVDEQYRLNFEK